MNQYQSVIKDKEATLQNRNTKWSILKHLFEANSYLLSNSNIVFSVRFSFTSYHLNISSRNVLIMGRILRQHMKGKHTWGVCCM
jgi:hypothetical protein